MITNLRQMNHMMHVTQRAYSANAGTDGLRTALSYCVNQVRTHDYENYLWCIQLPRVSFVHENVFRK